MSDIKIIDNFFPKYQQQEFLTILNDHAMCWTYMSNADHMTKAFRENDSQITPYDQFVVLLDEDKHKYWFDFFSKNIEIKLNTKIKKIIRMRLCFGFPRPLLQNFSYGTPHIDTKVPHTTIVYYGNNADGNTVLFKEFFKDEFDFSKKTVETMVEPKQGRALVFNGLRYHSVQPHSTKNRLLMNINFVEEAS